MQPNSIKITKRAKSRTMRMRVDEDLNILVYASKAFSDAQIQAFINKNQKWIQEQLKKQLKSKNKIQKILDDHPNQILHFGKWKSLESIDLTNNACLKKALLETLHQRVLHFSKAMELYPKKISVRLNKSVLGSCSYDNKLSFSLLLYFAPLDLLDYVIIHELAHIKHKNHSTRFWNLVSKFCKDYKQKRLILHQEIKLYHALYKHLFK